ncbi:MAG: ABC transporter permease, partial [Chloroflexi bacterium]|nr:ABC transporter permease [Chloroflexota bacterium]
MTRYLVQRLTSSGFVLFGLVTLAFFATHVIGDPVFLLVNRELATEEDRLAVVRAGGFDRPVPEQYVRFLGNALRGDFGRSIWQNRPAALVVLERLPATFLLAFSALAFSVVSALGLAVLATRTSRGWLAGGITALAIALSAVAPFWLAMVLVLVVAVQLGLLPSSGFGEPRHLVLPVLALAASPIGRLTQVLQTQLTSEMGQPYVT